MFVLVLCLAKILVAHDIFLILLLTKMHTTAQGVYGMEGKVGRGNGT